MADANDRIWATERDGDVVLTTTAMEPSLQFPEAPTRLGE
jgi:hypothetical protein